MDLELKDLKNPQTISSLVALGAVIGVAIVSQKQINSIRYDVEELKIHVGNLIPSVDPTAKNQLEQLNNALQSLDARVSMHDNKLDQLSSAFGQPTVSETPTTSYVRYTQKKSTAKDTEPVVVPLTEQEKSSLNKDLEFMLG